MSRNGIVKFGAFRLAFFWIAGLHAVVDIKYASKSAPTNQGDLTGLDGNRTTDFNRANTWALQPSPNGGGFTSDNFRRNGKGCQIKDPSHPNAVDGWVDCSWHHHQDGKSIMPVPKSIHRSNGIASNSHAGGVSVINNGIAGFFDSPSF